MRDIAIINYKILPRKFNQGPFKNFGELEKEYLAIQEKGCGFLGDFVLLSSGELKKGKQKGLHTRVAKLEAEFPESIHIYLSKSKSNFYLREEKGKIVTEYYPTSKKSRALMVPFYTLKSLYGALPNQEIGTRLKALRHEFHKHELQDKLSNFNNSIAKRNETKLKILEGIYTRDLIK